MKSGSSVEFIMGIICKENAFSTEHPAEVGRRFVSQAPADGGGLQMF